MPSSRPPTTAPAPLPRPPRIAAAKPFRPSITPTSQEVSVIGAIRMPAIAPSAADRPNDSSSTMRTLMPHELRRERGCARSRASPCRVSVRPKNQPSSSTMASVTPEHPQALRQDASRRASSIGVSPENGCSACRFLSQTSVARPRSRIEAPMVMMISVTTEAPRAGSTANFSSARPTAAAASTATGIASGSGSPASASDTVAMPPIITNSPCAKLMTWLAL